MPNLALVTGASAGLGLEFARIHAERGGDLVISARRTDDLNALKSELEAKHGVTVHVLPADLSTDGAARKLAADTLAIATPDILINNAGFGGVGPHVDRDLDAELSMIDLNIGALVSLTHVIGGAMASRGAGRILNVGSTAGFMPGPKQAVYFATKAFVNSYSQALDQELRPRGVTVSLLAPGYVETEFAKTADMEKTRLARGGGSTARAVSEMAYDAMLKGKLVTINDRKLAVMTRALPLMPRRTVLRVAEWMMSE